MPATFKNEKYAGMNFVYTFHDKNRNQQRDSCHRVLSVTDSFPGITAEHRQPQSAKDMVWMQCSQVHCSTHIKDSAQ
jgi:hypothetical protein